MSYGEEADGFIPENSETMAFCVKIMIKMLDINEKLIKYGIISI
ncbi:MAG: hypothetical protein ABIJ15_04710 [bacterium]